MTQNVSQEKRL